VWIVGNINTRAIREPLVLAALARGFLRSSVLVNRAIMQRWDIPPLYEAGVQFGREPWHGKGVEEFADCLTVYQRGWGDCDDLAPYRVAELQEQGERADFRIYWRFNRRGHLEVFHIQVRRANGWIEDPSRYLGMAHPQIVRANTWPLERVFSLAA